jgi:serine/threonine protein kinase
MSEPKDVGSFADEGSQDPRLVEWAAEIADRIKAGESVDLQDLNQAQPEHSDLLRRLLPAIEMMVALGTDPAAEAGEGRPGEQAPQNSLEVLGDFQLVRVLGHGGMGIVWEARQLSLGGRRVAVKILPAASALDPRQLRRFQVEVQAAACLDHEHIVPVYAVGNERGVPYYVMRLIEGRSLAEIIRQLPRAEGCEAPDEDTVDQSSPDVLATTLANNLTSGETAAQVEVPGEKKSIAGGVVQTVRAEGRPGSAAASSRADSAPTCDRTYFRNVARLAVEAAEALDYAHREGVLHRDVKPANLLVDLRGHLWVTDFGLARLRGDSGLTRTGDLIGTLRYMSPESAAGGARRAPVDHRTDVYSLGVTIYEMLTLQPAFGGSDRSEILRRIAEEEPRPPRRLSPRIPRDLETVVLKAMAKEPARRYQSAGELAADLARFLDGLPVLARRSPLWRKAVTWIRRHRTTASLIATGIAATLLIVLGWKFIHRKETELLARRFESARVADLAEIIPWLDTSDPAVVAWLDRLYAGADPEKKLAAALVLAPTRTECQTYILDQALTADPRLLGLLIPLLHRQIPGPFTARLEEEIQGEPSAGLRSGEAELRDRRRANAACALIALGREGPAWQLLCSAPDPQARSYLIATLGPAGVEPDRLVPHLEDPRMSDSSRSALIQSLGDAPKASWPSGRFGEVVSQLLRLYRHDPDAGLHGSAKWLLLRWGLGAEVQRIDEELAKTQRDDPRFQWRISHEGLTLVTVDHPNLHRIIEVSDTEVTVELFRRFRAEFPFDSKISPEHSCPVNGTSYHDVAAFCNWLGGREGLPEGEECYRRLAGAEKPAYLPVSNHRDHLGFRLPANEEFEVICAAGTKARRYFGDSDLLLDRYAWTLTTSEGRAHPVAGKRPNDFGLFDTLGNIQEWCERAIPPGCIGHQSGDLRGGWFGWSPPSEVDRSSVVPNIPLDKPDATMGFRVVRTIMAR